MLDQWQIIASVSQTIDANGTSTGLWIRQDKDLFSRAPDSQQLENGPSTRQGLVAQVCYYVSGIR